MRKESSGVSRFSPPTRNTGRLTSPKNPTKPRSTSRCRTSFGPKKGFGSRLASRYMTQATQVNDIRTKMTWLADTCDVSRLLRILKNNAMVA